MNKEELFRDLKETTYCRLMPSKLGGVGVFAIKRIPKGTWPFKTCKPFSYFRIPKEEIKALPKAIGEYVMDMFACDDKYYFVSRQGMNNLDISYFVNHSKKPNLSVKYEPENFYTLRDIKPGEELTVDYQEYSEEDCNFRKT